MSIDDDIVYARAHTGIVKGICVHVNENNQVVHAGPIGSMPKVGQKNCVLMNPEDFERFKTAVQKRKN